MKINVNKKKFLWAKEVLKSNPTICSLLVDPNLSTHSYEKLQRLVGILSFICLDGIWDIEGKSEVLPQSSLKELGDPKRILKNVAYGDLFKGNTSFFLDQDLSSNLSKSMVFDELLNLAEHRGYCLGAEAMLRAKNAWDGLTVARRIAQKMMNKGFQKDVILELTDLSEKDLGF